MVLLCSKHHRAVHEGGYVCHLTSEHSELSFLRPDGQPVELPPTDQASHVFAHPPVPDAGRCLWAGEHLDLDLAVEGLCHLKAQSLTAA